MNTERLATAHSDRGELSLRVRPSDGAVELRVNGVFVMDTAQTASERLLAEAALDQVSGGKLRVLVGGLGLGFTLARLLESDRVAAVHVAEIEPDLIAWHQAGLIPHTAGALSDPRVEIAVGDVADVLSGLDPASVDLILLDVDNGPDFLVYEQNAALYSVPLLRRCRRATAPGGLTAIWSMSDSASLAASLREVFGSVRTVPVEVTLGARDEHYWLYLVSG